MALTVVGLDLAWAHTGMVALKDGTAVGVGQINTTAQMAPSARAIKLYEGLLNMAHTVGRDAVWYVEKTDWHQSGNNRSAYAREREARDALGMAMGVFLTFAGMLDLKYRLIGVSEWHSEFGAKRKDSIAEMVLAQFPVLAQRWAASDHITDAAAIAFVGLNRERVYDAAQEV